MQHYPVKCCCATSRLAEWCVLGKWATLCNSGSCQLTTFVTAVARLCGPGATLLTCLQLGAVLLHSLLLVAVQLLHDGLQQRVAAVQGGVAGTVHIRHLDAEVIQQRIQVVHLRAGHVQSLLTPNELRLRRQLVHILLRCACGRRQAAAGVLDGGQELVQHLCSGRTPCQGSGVS